LTPYEESERPPNVGLGLIKRGLLAMFLVVSMSATALATTVVLEVDDVKNAFLGEGRLQVDIPEITKAEAGGARTILLLGSDARYEDKKLGLKPRSDTILLVRADPDRDAIAVMSIPRDLKAEIPGRGTDKINAAFEHGGERLAVRAIKKLFEDATGDEFPINNVISVEFGSFRRAVDYIGGVYVDVDRDYFNDNSHAATQADKYATIDVDPGYQKLMGRDALDYVRYRHTDNDFIRAARQQDFLRQARNQAGVRKLVSIGDRKRLARVFGRYFTVDKSFRSNKEIFSMLRLALYLIQENPSVNEVRFRADEAENPAVDTRLYASASQLKQTVREFMNARASSKPVQTSEPTAEDQESARLRRKRNRNKAAAVPGLEEARAQGVDQAVLADPKLKFPFYFPALRTTGAAYAGTQPRVYKIRDEEGKKHEAYRLVLSKGIAGEYYGVQGMTWKDPPILDNPDEVRRVGGRKLRLYYDGRRVRLVAWKTRRAVYWISNTLSQSLNSRQMLAIADSLTRLKQ
jgi:polyisoprenyl-teichoic acid--peptidoglycan teichoic acid transferase